MPFSNPIVYQVMDWIGKNTRKVWLEKAYYASGFHKYGLWRDDFFHEDRHPHVKEALRRLPQDTIDERNFRLVRAMTIDAQKKYLPEEQWTKLENDVLYLTPLIEEIEKEEAEKAAWDP
ncbi:cytochrome b-c1 complex subunit 7-like [Prorops nasuta]|uniref:cytochrome b-c1 complex subunit 7-like n=1 Tax=Prorops nasuta TaxID=863751 RepID=UPI0034CD70C1